LLKLSGGPKEMDRALRNGTPGKRLPVLAQIKTISRRKQLCKDTSSHLTTVKTVSHPVTPWDSHSCKEVSELYHFEIDFS
jgi:hypothetical protein